MKYAVIIDVNARVVGDGTFWESLTPEQRAERIGEMKADVRRLIADEMDEGAEVDVKIRIEEAAE